MYLRDDCCLNPTELKSIMKMLLLTFTDPKSNNSFQNFSIFAVMNHEKAIWNLKLLLWIMD